MTRATADWERIEIEYRAGAKSVRELAAENGVSHTAVQKRSKAENWPRDIAGKVKARADALVAKHQVATEISVATKATQSLTVEIAAQVETRIRIAHRTDIGRARKLTMSMFAELEGMTSDPEAFAKLGEILIDPSTDRVGKLQALFDKAISLPGRADTLKKLTDSLRGLIEKEREAYGMISADKASAGDGLPVVIVRDFSGRPREVSGGPVVADAVELREDQ